MADADTPAEVRRALARMTAAHDRAVAAIEAETDLDEAVNAANELAAHTRKLDTFDAELRTRLVGKLWDAQRLSLAALADRIGVSKSRADQLIRSAKKDREEQQ